MKFCVHPPHTPKSLVGFVLPVDRAVQGWRRGIRRVCRLVERQISEGSHGLLINATSGEPTTLTLDERFEIAVMANSVSAGRVLVRAGP